MPQFKVIVTIENKPGLSDPEGKTILKDLILKEGQKRGGGNSASDNTQTEDADAIGGKISDIRTAKMLRFTIDSADADSAARQIKEVCDRLHIYNPIVSVAHVTVDNGMKK